MTKQAHIVILGGRGMLGSDLAAVLRHDTGREIRVHDLPECDITDPDHLRHALRGAGTIVNCAAYTNVDMAESQPEKAFAVNARAVGSMAEIARRQGSFLAHISTDFVFDGRLDRPYREDDPPAPLSVYGRSKLQGEQALRDAGGDWLIVRVQWSYGRHGANFISRLLDRAAGGGELKVVDDQVGAPTWTLDMSRAIADLLRKRCAGLYHFANLNYTSRYDMALFIKHHLKLSNPMVPCPTRAFPAPAARPLNSRFDLTAVSAQLDRPIRAWDTALAEYLGAGQA